MSKKQINEGYLDCDCQQNIEENFNRMAKNKAQPDLSVNDESDPAFVKGRTHYVTKTKTYGNPKTYSCTSSYLNGYQADDFFKSLNNYDKNRPFIVMFDGVEYGGNSVGYEGNPYLIDSSNTDTGEPFAFKFASQGFYYMVVREAGDHEVALGNVDIEYVTLPLEYLPEEVMTANEIDNYIKNAVHFNPPSYTEDTANKAVISAQSDVYAYVGESVFKDCSALTTVIFPKATEVKDQGFYRCHSLVDPYLPMVTTIGSSGFYETSIKKIDEENFPSLTQMGSYSFAKCYILESVNHSGITTITDSNCFNNCTNLKKVTLPSLQEVPLRCFYECSGLTEVNLPSITSIGDYGFYGCRSLTQISLPAGVTKIGNYVFRYCNGLTSVTFKGTPTSISSNAFTDCTNLTTINVPWSEGAVANAPWGATNATINYDYTGK